MQILNDKTIRVNLINFLNSRQPTPLKIVEELRVNNSNAIADVVTIHKGIHCYEIKGDNDKIQRALQQAVYYNKLFPKITLVTTEKYKKIALKKMPFFWGIMICKIKNEKIKFYYARKGAKNPYIDKQQALLTMWKEELIEFAQELSIQTLKKYHNRDIFATEIAKQITTNDLIEGMSKKILKREVRTDWSRM